MSRWFLAPAAGAVLAFVLVGCSGGGDDDEGPAGSPPVGETGLPNDVQGGLIIYRNTLEADTVAVTLDHGRTFSFDFDPNEETVLSVDCTRDGARAAYLMENFTSLDKRVVISDGSGRREVQLQGEVGGAAISPDGSQIAVTAYLPENGRGVLSLVDVESQEVTPQYDRPGPIGGPRWSSDGSKIVFHAAAETQNQIFVYTLGDTEAVQITNEPEGAFQPDWSPDGATIAFSAFTGQGAPQLFTVAATGGAVSQLTSTQPFKANPRWSVDGSRIAYVGTVLVPTVSRVAVRLHNVAVYTSASDGSDEAPFTDVALDAWLLGWCTAGPWLGQGWTEQ